ncbi:MAG: hypothetical protein ACYC5O_15810, partial [Anaerolineae bacterium]
MASARAVGGRIGRLARASRARGLAGTATWAWRKAADRLSLEAQAARQRLLAGRLPSDAEVLQPGTWPDLASYLQHLAAAESAAFLLPPAATGEYAAALVAHYRDNTSATIDAAERLC